MPPHRLTRGRDYVPLGAVKMVPFRACTTPPLIEDLFTALYLEHRSRIFFGLLASEASRTMQGIDFLRDVHVVPIFHVYLNSVQQMVSGGLAGEGLQTGFSRHGLPPQRAPLDTVYPLREHLNSVQQMVSGGYCEGLFPDTVCWTRLRNTWILKGLSKDDVTK